MERSEAQRLGLKRYVTGKLCSSGHAGERRVVDGHCMECNRARDRGRRPPGTRAISRPASSVKLARLAGEVTYSSGRPCKHGHIAPRFTCSGTCTECARNRYQSVPGEREKVIAASKAYYQANRDEVRRKQNAYHRSNPPARLKARARYEQRIRERTPPWLTDEHWWQISEFYQACPPGHHVDHIIPLHGRNVCGLHVPWNLQYLTGPENLRKGNSFPAP